MVAAIMGFFYTYFCFRVSVLIRNFLPIFIAGNSPAVIRRYSEETETFPSKKICEVSLTVKNRLLIVKSPDVI